MKELIILYYGNFAILRERVRDFTWHTICSNHIADRTLRNQIFLNKLRREHPGWTTSHRQEWGLFLLQHLLHYAASMKKKECWGCSQRSQDEETEEVAPEHPSMRALLDATDDDIIQVVEQVYQGEWTLAPNVLSHHQHKDCMRKLWWGLNRCMARAGLQEAQGTQDTLSSMRTSRSRRCSWGCSAS